MSGCSRAARQRREFQEIEEQAFPSFPARPLPMPNGRRGDGQGCIIVGDEDFVGKVQGQTVIVGKTKSDGAGGAEAGRLAADDDTEEGDEEVGFRCSLRRGICRQGSRAGCWVGGGLLPCVPVAGAVVGMVVVLAVQLVCRRACLV